MPKTFLWLDPESNKIFENKKKTWLLFKPLQNFLATTWLCLNFGSICKTILMAFSARKMQIKTCKQTSDWSIFIVIDTTVYQSLFYLLIDAILHSNDNLLGLT